MLSEAEEAEMNRARAGYHDHDHGSDDGHESHRPYHEHEDDIPEDHSVERNGLSTSTYDSQSRLMKRHHSDEQPQHAHHDRHREAADHARHAGGMGMKNTFNFSAMEDFAGDERATNAAARPIINGHGARTREIDFAQTSNEALGAHPESYATTALMDGEETLSPGRNSETGERFARRRHRKMSNSNPVSRRQGKLALFEGFGSSEVNPAALHPTATIAPDMSVKGPRQPKNALSGIDTPAFTPYTDAPMSGHDRPYRFSFYSNALPVTIHARSLAELPADGQSFEDLFKGKNEGVEDVAGLDGTEVGSFGTDKRSGIETPVARDEKAPKASLLAKAMTSTGKIGGDGGSPNPDGPGFDEDPEQFTWWLDVLNPTDEEMRMMTKVRLQYDKLNLLTHRCLVSTL